MTASGGSMAGLRLLMHLLLPLFAFAVSQEMTQPVLVDVITSALCPGYESNCSEAIYLNGLQQTVVGIFKTFMVPLLAQLSDDYGRKPFLLLAVSSPILPYALLAINQSKGFIYAYYVLRTISYILSKRSIFCFSVAYAADIVKDGRRAAVFSWITGLFTASHILGGFLARFLPENYIFKAAAALSLFGLVYMQIFLVETIYLEPREEQKSKLATRVIATIREIFLSLKLAASIAITSPMLMRISAVSFFYELGMSGISTVLLYYLKAAFGFDKNQFSEILMLVGVGSVASQWVVMPLINPLAGEKAILCIGLVASISSAIFYGIAWSSWVVYIGASFGVAQVLVKPSTYAIISKSSSSADQGKTQGLVAGVESMASLLSSLAMSPLTLWFLSNNAPFNCKGFSLVCASLCMMVALGWALSLKPEVHSSHDVNVDAQDLSSPLL